MSMPLAFMATEGNYIPVAVQGFAPGQNLFVGPDNRWREGKYIPAVYRSHPFRLAKSSEGELVLCIDEDSGLVTDGPEGEPFFTEEGKPTQAVTEAFNFLMQIERERAKTHKACEALSRHSLIEPWPLHVQEGEEQKPVTGLYWVNERALNALDAQALAELRDAGALPLAFGHLFSIQHIHELGKLRNAPAGAGVQAQGAGLQLLDDNGIISFGNL